MNYARVKKINDGLEFYSSYDAGLVAGVKSLPHASRKPHYENGKFKCWVIAPQYIDKLDDLCRDYLGIPLDIPAGVNTAPTRQAQQKLFRIEYIGGLKDRGSGELTAFGAINGNQQSLFDDDVVSLDWSVIFSESVLRQWFEGSANQSLVQSTYYSVLAIKQSVPGNEIKKAWRKQMKRYHPDINKDTDAQEMTIKIQKAYEILSNPQMRRRYDAGLRLEQTVKQQPTRQSKYWSAPVRCGYVMCKGYYEVGRFIVEEILEWQDIIENGQMLVTSWDTGTNSLVRSWI